MLSIGPCNDSHLGDATRCPAIIIVMDKTSVLPLGFLQFGDILVYGSHAGEAYSSVGLTSAVQAVSLASLVHLLRLRLKNPRVFLRFGCRRVHMTMPREVMADVHSEVLTTIHHFECMPMGRVFCLSLQVFMMTDPDNLALLWTIFALFLT